MQDQVKGILKINWDVPKSPNHLVVLVPLKVVPSIVRPLSLAQRRIGAASADIRQEAVLPGLSLRQVTEESSHSHHWIVYVRLRTRSEPVKAYRGPFNGSNGFCRSLGSQLLVVTVSVRRQYSATTLRPMRWIGSRDGQRDRSWAANSHVSGLGRYFLSMIPTKGMSNRRRAEKSQESGMHAHPYLAQWWWLCTSCRSETQTIAGPWLPSRTKPLGTSPATRSSSPWLATPHHRSYLLKHAANGMAMTRIMEESI